MKIYSETSLDRFEAWSGGRDTLDVLIEKDSCDQLEAMLENDIFPDGCTDTELNDLLWFERDTIAEWLGFSDWEDLENDEEEEEETSIEEAENSLHECIENEDDFHTFCDSCKCSSCPFNAHCNLITNCEAAYNLMLRGYSFDEAVNKV